MRHVKKSMWKALFVSLICWALSSCGYRWHYDYPDQLRPTVSIPFIAEDEDGALNSEVIAALENSGIVDVVSKNGTYQLRIEILSNRNEKIGYRRDPQQIGGETKKNLLASEGRRSIDAKVSLYNGSGVIYGPYQITANSEYDYVDGDSLKDLTFIDKKGKLVEVLPFSLGQLESIESAQEATSKPLYRALAKKIVDVISAEW